MIGKHGIFLDARTKDKSRRVTSFSGNLEPVMRDLQNWMDENGLKGEDLWYADIFDTATMKMIMRLEAREDGITAVAAPKDLKIRPFRRHRTLKQVLAVWLRKTYERLEKTAWEGDN